MKMHLKLDQEAILANKEEILITIFNESSPSDVLHSKALLSALKQWFGRGTPRDVQRLQNEVMSSRLSTTPLLEGPDTTAASPVVSNAIVPATPAQKAADVQWQCVASLPTALLSLSSKDVSPIATQFFQQRTSAGRVKNLLKAVNRFISVYQSLALEDVLEKSSGLLAEGDSQISTGLVVNGLPNVWSGGPRPFGDHAAGTYIEDHFKRIENIFRGRWRLDKSIAHAEFARRLTYVFFAHEIDELKKLDYTLQRGERPETAVFDIIAKRFGTQAKVIQKEHYRSKNYKYLLQKGGSGALLLLGSDTRTLWELTLNEDDIDILLEFRRRFLPQIDKLSSTLNHPVRDTIRLGMTAYGWNSGVDATGVLLETLRNEEEEEEDGRSVTKRLRDGTDSSDLDSQSPSWSGSKCSKRLPQLEDGNQISCEAPSNTIPEGPINSLEVNNGVSSPTGARNFATEGTAGQQIGSQTLTASLSPQDENTLEINGSYQTAPGHSLQAFIYEDFQDDFPFTDGSYQTVPGHSLQAFIYEDFQDNFPTTDGSSQFYPSVNNGNAWGQGFTAQDANSWPNI